MNGGEKYLSKEKVFLCLGNINSKVDEVIKKANINIVDYENNINLIYDILDIVDMDVLVINRMLDDTNGDILCSIASKAKVKGINIIILLEEMESSKERKLVTRLINENVTSFISYRELTKRKIEKNVKKYPKEFDFKMFSKARIEYREIPIVKSMFKKVIAIYSPLSQGSSTIAAHMATSIANSQSCRVCLIDFNPLKPSFKRIFDKQEFNNTIVDVFLSIERNTLTVEKLEGLLTTSKEQKNLDILPGYYDINDYYTQSNNANFLNHVNQLIEKLKLIYDYVVIDTHSYYDMYLTNHALVTADNVVVPLFGNNHDIEEINRYIKGFETYNDFDIRKFSYVINRYSQKDLTFIEVEGKLNGDVVGYISESNHYREGSVFGNTKLMNEYISILRGLGLSANRKLKINEILRLKFNKNNESVEVSE